MRQRGENPATAPANDGPGNEAYRSMRSMLERVQADERARGATTG